MFIIFHSDITNKSPCSGLCLQLLVDFIRTINDKLVCMALSMYHKSLELVSLIEKKI